MPMQLMYGTLLIYVKLDTALLADVFENFRDKLIEIDNLDPAHFLTTPGLSWGYV